MRRWEEHGCFQHESSSARARTGAGADSVANSGTDTVADTPAYTVAHTIAIADTGAVSIAHSGACNARTGDCSVGRKPWLFQRDRQCCHALSEQPGHAVQPGHAILR